MDPSKMTYKQRRLEAMKIRLQLSDQLAAASDKYHAIMQSGVFHCAQSGPSWVLSRDKALKAINALLFEIARANTIVERIDALDNFKQFE